MVKSHEKTKHRRGNTEDQKTCKYENMLSLIGVKMYINFCFQPI